MTEEGHSGSKMKGVRRPKVNTDLCRHLQIQPLIKAKRCLSFSKSESTGATNFINLLAFTFCSYCNWISVKTWMFEIVKQVAFLKVHVLNHDIILPKKISLTLPLRWYLVTCSLLTVTGNYEETSLSGGAGLLGTFQPSLSRYLYEMLLWL